MAKIEIDEDPSAAELRADRADIFREAYALITSVRLADDLPSLHEVFSVVQYLEDE